MGLTVMSGGFDMSMSRDAITNHKNKIDRSKSLAENGIYSGINNIINEIAVAARTLETNGQRVEINVDDIVADLKSARDEWLTSVKKVSDAAISGLKGELEKL
jgi:hypothetical protein